MTKTNDSRKKSKKVDSFHKNLEGFCELTEKGGLDHSQEELRNSCGHIRGDEHSEENNFAHEKELICALGIKEEKRKQLKCELE